MPTAHRHAVVVAVFTAACGSSSKAGTPGDFAHDFELASCEQKVACGTMPDLETCLAVTDDQPVDDDYSYATLIDSVSTGRVVFDATAAASCVGSVADSPCDPDEGGTDPSCWQVFTGTVPEGGACQTHLDCVSGTCSGLLCGAQCCQGVCAAPDPDVRIVGEGEDCDGEESVCAEGLWCRDGVLGGATCARQATAGESCESFDGCATGLDCISSPTEHAYCAKRPAAGEPCDPTAWSYCADGDRYYCDPASRTCSPRKPLGAACQTGPDVRDPGCVDFAACRSGACELLPDVGEPCDSLCLGDLTCSDDGVCLPAETFGVACAQP